ncbi:MAG: glycoside hydrolase domain-containing protein [Armatimonadota bacterium]
MRYCILILLIIICLCSRLYAKPMVPVLYVPDRDIAKEKIGYMPSAVNQFKLINVKEYAVANTEVSLAFDKEKIYIHFKCYEPFMDKLVLNHNEHDSQVYLDDSIEVFFITDKEKAGFYHLIANANGVKYDEKDKFNTPESWDPNWNIEIEKYDDYWTAFISISFNQLNIDVSKLESDVLVNFARNRMTSEERSTWAYAKTGLLDPDEFGILRFQDDNAVIPQTFLLNIINPDDYELKIIFHNFSQKAQTIEAEIITADMLIKKQTIKVPPGYSENTLKLKIADENIDYFILQLRLKNKKEPFFVSRKNYIYIPKHRTKLSEIIRYFENLPRPNESTFEGYKRVKKILENTLKFSKTADNPEKWRKLENLVEISDRAVENIIYSLLDTNQMGYLYGTALSTEKIRKDKIFRGEINSKLSINLAKNEYEAGQIAIIPYKKDLKNIKVRIEPLVSENGKSIDSKYININLVDYVHTRKPSYNRYEYIGWHPDPLMPYTDNFDVKIGEIKPLWITVYANKDVSAGIYKGSIEISPENAEAVSVPIEVKIFNFELPEKTTLKTAFALFEKEIESWYGKYTEDMKKDFYDFLLQRRINPTNIYTQTPMPNKDYIPYAIEKGMNCFNLAYIGNVDENTLSMIGEYRDYLLENNWLDLAFVYGWDEVLPNRYQEARKNFMMVKERYPDIKTMCTVVPNKVMNDAIDIWVPLTAAYDKKVAQEYEKQGDEVWWYICCVPADEHANWFIDYPLIESRIIFWQTWKYRIPGFLYYAINLWRTNRLGEESGSHIILSDNPEDIEKLKQGKKWPDVGWNTFTFANNNGDGHLIYPGPDGKPISSIRFENIRDGIEDYEYFVILDELVKKAEQKGLNDSKLKDAKKVLDVREEIVKSKIEYTRNPKMLLDARNEIAELIEYLQKCIN